LPGSKNGLSRYSVPLAA